MKINDSKRRFNVLVKWSLLRQTAAWVIAWTTERIYVYCICILCILYTCIFMYFLILCAAIWRNERRLRGHYYLGSLILKPDLYDSDAKAGLGSECLSHFATRFWVHFKRRLELSSLARRQNRPRSLRTFRLVAVAVVDTAIVISCINTHHKVKHEQTRI